MLNLNTLKESIQSMLQTANTTTASPDLSASMASRVQRVLKVNPSQIPIQTSFYPWVTVYIDSKDITNKTIARSQAQAYRRGEVHVKVIGAVWNSLNSDSEVDPADEDCELLMESIEQILRNDPTLGGVALESYPTAVTYHNVQLQEEANVRAGILNLKTVFMY